MPLLHGWHVRGILEHIVDGDEAGGRGLAAPRGRCGLLVAGIGDLKSRVAARAFVSVYVAMLHWMGMLEFGLHAMQPARCLLLALFAFSLSGGDCGQV